MTCMVILVYLYLKCTVHNKRWRKAKGQPRMDNLETLATLGTQETGRRQTKQKHNRKLKS